MDSLIKFQKRAAILILDKDLETPSAELFAELKWLTFPERVKFQKAVMMFKTMNNLNPPYTKAISLQYIFQVMYVLCFTRPRYQVSVYRTIGPLVNVIAA